MAKIKIIDVVDHQAKAFRAQEYPITKVIYKPPFKTKVESKLPFRVKFETIGIGPAYGPNNVPPIGVAVIGFNNYIL